LVIGGDGKAIIQIEKMKQPRTIERTLKTDAPDSKNHRFGTVYVDPEEPKLAQFIVNKASGGGKKSGSGRGKKENKSPYKKGGKKGGASKKRTCTTSGSSSAIRTCTPNALSSPFSW